MSRKVTYGDIPRLRTKYLLNALLQYVNYEIDDCDDLQIKFNWVNEKELRIQGDLKELEKLTERCGDKLESWQIRDALSEYLNEKFLGILEDHRLNKQGKMRSFQLNLWYQGYDILSNLKTFDQEWKNKNNYQVRPEVAPLKSSAQASYLDYRKINGYAIYLDDYVERPPIEENCLKALKQEQSLLRIRAPYNMGKTRLVDWLIYHVKPDNYQTVIIDCEEEKSTLSLSNENFVRAICRTITQELNINESYLDKFWQRPGTPAHKARRYLEEYILKPSLHPIVLVFEKFDTILETEAFGNEFCGLLRSWHEKRSNDWRKLRLVIVHSTEFYANYDFYSSPLMGVGYVVSLPDFTEDQVFTLARMKGLDWTLPTVQKLMQLVGGNPYLVKLVINSIHEGTSLEIVLENAIQGREPFQSHFRVLMRYLQKNPALNSIFQQILSGKPLTSAQLKGESAQFLERLGLITRKADSWQIRCYLYQIYFQDLFDHSV